MNYRKLTAVVALILFAGSAYAAGPYEVTIKPVDSSGSSVVADRICMSTDGYSNCITDRSETTFLAPEGSHDIEIEAEGYRDVNDNDYISRDQTKTYHLESTREQFRITDYGPSGDLERSEKLFVELDRNPDTGWCKWDEGYSVDENDDLMGKPDPDRARWTDSHDFGEGSHTVTFQCFDHKGSITGEKTTSFTIGGGDERPSINLRSPSDGSTGVSRNPSYSWKITDSSGVDDVTLYVEEKGFSGDEPWNQPDFTYDVSDSVGSVVTFRSSVTQLDPNQEYVWGIKVEEGYEDFESEEVYSFTTEGRDDDGEDEDGSLTVTVRDGDNDRLENAEVRIKNGDYDTDTTNYRGDANFHNLDPDHYDIRVRCDGETERDSAHVSSGEDESLTVSMDRHSPDDYCGDQDEQESDPEASFSISDTNPEIGERVRFDASGSDGDIMEYRWAFPDGTSKYGEVVYKSFDSAGRKNVQLKVTEYDYDQDRTSRALNVQRRDDDGDEDEEDEEREDPVARLDIDPSSAEIGEEIEFDATESYDNGEIEEYRFDLDGDGDWDVENDDGEVERTFFRTFDGEARVKVIDDDGRSDIADEDYEIRSRGRVSITTLEMPDKVCDGESFEARFEVRHLGDDERFVVLDARGFGETRSRTIEIEEDERREVSFQLTAGSAGSRTVEVSARNSNVVRETVEVLECQEDDREVSDMSVSVSPDRVNAGESLKVSGYVENTRGRENVRVLINGRLGADTTTQPDGYYQVYVRTEEVGTANIVASSGDRTVRTSAQVLPTVQVSGLETPRNIFQGESFDICAQVNSQVDTLVVLTRNGERIDSKTDRGRVCFETASNTAGETEYRIGAYALGAGDSVSREVEILETKPETTSFPGQVASVESGDGIVKATIYNNHKEQRRYSLKLSGLPSTWISTSEKQVILQPGEQREVFFYLTPREEGQRTADVEIESRGSTIYDESVDVWTGGTTENQSRSIMWRLRNAVSWW